MNTFVAVASNCRVRRQDGTGRGWAMARQWVLGLSLTLACQCALAQAMYRIKPIGYLEGCTSSVPTVAGLNGKDEVAGTACNANGDSHAFLWKNDGTTMVDLGPDEVGSGSYAIGINAAGLVGGQLSDPGCAWYLLCLYAFESSGDGTPMRRIPYIGIWPSAMNDRGELTGSTGDPDDSDPFLWSPDGTPDGHIVGLDILGDGGTFGQAINASGQVAGYSASFTDSSRRRAVVWLNDGPGILNLGTLRGFTDSEAFLINTSGQVAGINEGYTRTNVFRTHAFFWRNVGTRMQDLGTLGGTDSFPNALNDSGQIAGYSKNANGATHAFVWLNDGTTMKDLGTLGGTHSSADDINFSGQVTGNAAVPGNAVTHAFLWRNDGTNIQDLNTLIDPNDPLKPYITLTDARYVNDSGDILAYGTDSRTGLGNVPYLLQGTVLTLAPRSLTFGKQPVKTTSSTQSVTVTNTSAKVVAITSIALTGAAPGQFASTNNCGKSIAGHATCTIKVNFKPTTKGAKSATLNVNGGGGGLRAVTLTGTGT